MKLFLLILTSVLSGILTYAISHILKRGGVIASAIVTLSSGMLLPYFFPSIGTELAVAAACASYAGMISLENAVNFLEMALISLLTGILFVAASTAYPGIGGRLGTIAGIACFSWLGLKKVYIDVAKRV